VKKRRGQDNEEEIALILRPNFVFLNKETLQVRMGKEKALCILGQRLKVNTSYFELSRRITVYNVFINYFDILYKITYKVKFIFLRFSLQGVKFTLSCKRKFVSNSKI
jgi:hypothetical protein